MTSYYTEQELKELGFAELGEHVQISRKVSIYGASQMRIGNHVRIDDFCVLSGKITFGNYIHIAVMTALFGGTAGITLEDFSAISSRCAVYATTDDYSGEYMTNPTVPEEYTNVINAPVRIGKHAIIGTGSTILQGDHRGGVRAERHDAGGKGHKALGDLYGVSVHPGEGEESGAVKAGSFRADEELMFHLTERQRKRWETFLLLF